MERLTALQKAQTSEMYICRMSARLRDGGVVFALRIYLVTHGERAMLGVTEP